MSLQVTILGSGNSEGTPSIGNFWGACDPAESKNNRTRPSIAVQSETTTLIVDTSPDFRQQMNRENINGIDAVLYTHAHSDHVSGIDDLRALYKQTQKQIPVYADRPTMTELQDRFSYQFVEKSKIYPQVLMPHILDQFYKPMTIGDIEFIPFEQDHGTCVSLGFRFGDLAYSTDLVGLPEESLEVLQGIKTWIVDAAGYKMPLNRVHFTLENLYKINEVIKAPQIYLTHLSPAMDYQTLLNELPPGYAPAYDGMRLNCA